VLKNNTITSQGSFGAYHLEVTGGALQMANNSFTGPIDLINFSGTAPLTIADLSASGCVNAVYQTSTQPLTIAGSAIDCTRITDYMSTGAGTVTIEYSDIAVSERLATMLIGTRQFNANNIVCDGAGCDLVVYQTAFSPGVNTFSFTGNNITCQGTCRGGIVYNGSLYPGALMASYDFTDNHWIGKQPPKGADTFFTLIDYGDTGDIGTADAAGIALYEYTAAHPGTPVAPTSGQWAFTGNYQAADPGARTAGRAAWPGL
jgi:hypothetical protein